MLNLKKQTKHKNSSLCSTTIIYCPIPNLRQKIFFRYSVHYYTMSMTNKPTQMCAGVKFRKFIDCDIKIWWIYKKNKFSNQFQNQQVQKDQDVVQLSH